MPLLGYVWLKSAWPKGWPNVKLTWCCTTLGHQMPLLEGMSELRSTGPKLVIFVATRCLYQGVHLTEGQPDPKANQMSSWSDVVALLATGCLYGGISELRSTGSKLVIFVATRCLYQGVHLTEGQPDPKVDQMSSWPEMPVLGGSIWLKCKKDI